MGSGTAGQLQECLYATPGYRYSDPFKATAVRLSQLAGVSVRDVAESLYIHLIDGVTDPTRGFTDANDGVADLTRGFPDPIDGGTDPTRGLPDPIDGVAFFRLRIDAKVSR